MKSFNEVCDVLKKINFNLDQKIFKIDERLMKIISLQKEGFLI